MKYYRILAKRDYEHNGKQERKWYRIGDLKFTDQGGKYLRLYQFPQEDYYVVEVTEGDDERSIAID